MKLKSLKSKLLSLSILLVVVTITPTIVIMITLVNRNALKSHESTVAEAINTVDSAIALFYDELDRDIDMFASHPLLKRADDTISKYIGFGPGEFKSSDKGGIEQQIFEAFDHYGNTHPGTLYVYMGTEDGGYIQWPETRTDGDFDPRVRPWYQAAMSGNGTVMRTEPYSDIVTKSLIVSNARTFEDANGVVYGAVAIDVSSEKLTKILEEMKLGETGHFMMLHKSGVVLADPKFPKHNLKMVDEIGIEGFNKVVTQNQASFVADIEGTRYKINSSKSNKTDWILVGVIEEQELYKTARSILTSIVISTLLISSAICALALWFSNKIVSPIASVSKSLQSIAEGDADLTQRLEIKTQDEVGDLAKWFNTFLEKLQHLVTQIQKNSSNTILSTEDLNQLSINLDENSRSLSQKSKKVSESTEELSGNISTVASAVEEYSHNINVVATGGEEMTASVDEIARSSSMARDVTSDSVRKVEATTQQMKDLGIAAQEITEVTKVINAISDQTNLLALNATIEAASAGEAGKGFAVVANEIKELAKQTAEATTKIENQISNIQKTTEVSIEGISQINEIINEIDSIVTTIAAAVEEQSATSKEISTNITQASDGIQDVSHHTAQGSIAISGIASEIAEVDQLVQGISSISGHLRKKASELKESESRLAELVSRFSV